MHELARRHFEIPTGSKCFEARGYFFFMAAPAPSWKTSEGFFGTLLGKVNSSLSNAGTDTRNNQQTIPGNGKALLQIERIQANVALVKKEQLPERLFAREALSSTTIWNFKFVCPPHCCGSPRKRRRGKGKKMTCGVAYTDAQVADFRNGRRLCASRCTANTVDQAFLTYFRDRIMTKTWEVLKAATAEQQHGRSEEDDLKKWLQARGVDGKMRPRRRTRTC